MTALDAPIWDIRLDDASPLFDEAWVATIIDAAFRDLRVDVGLDKPAPAPKPARLPRVHLTERRRAVYDASMLVWLYAAGA